MKSSDESSQELHASLALLPVDASQVDYLYGRMLSRPKPPRRIPVLREALKPHQSPDAEALDRAGVGEAG